MTIISDVIGCLILFAICMAIDGLDIDKGTWKWRWLGIITSIVIVGIIEWSHIVYGFTIPD